MQDRSAFLLYVKRGRRGGHCPACLLQAPRCRTSPAQLQSRGDRDTEPRATRPGRGWHRTEDARTGCCVGIPPVRAEESTVSTIDPVALACGACSSLLAVPGLSFLPFLPFPLFPRMRGGRAATAGQELRTAAAARSADGAGPGLCPLLPSPPGGLAALTAFVAQVLWLRSLKPG